MKLIAASVVLAAIGLAHPAAAADMPLKAPVAPVFSWTGFYAGVHAGWGWNDPTGTTTITDAGTTALTAQHDLGANGPLFGGHIGYNWQINPRWVVGIEGDITGTGIKAFSAQNPFCPTSNPFCTPAQTLAGGLTSMSQEVNWLASLRGRVGAIWGPGMVYVTGGVAWANVDYKANTGDDFFVCGGGNACAYPAESNTTKTGWTVGAGYEAALAGNWTVRAEYLYYNFGGETLTAAGTPQSSCTTGSGIVPPCAATYSFPDLNIHTVRVGLTYKLGQPAGAPLALAAFAPRAAAPVRGWTGLYAGVHAGWGFNDPTGTSNLRDSGTALLTAQHDLGANGPLFGGHIGYNWQISPTLVTGIEGDITGTGIKASSAQSATCPTSFFCSTPQAVPGALITMSQNVNWLASIRGRLGTTWGASLIYVTGGVAWANVDSKANTGDDFFICGSNTACAFPVASNTTKTGWTVGAGYETALIGNWTVRAEYLYYSFSGETLTTSGSPAANCTTAFGLTPPCNATYTFPDLKIHTARLGASYKF